MPTLRSFLHSERVKTRVLTRFVGDRREYPRFVDDICDYANQRPAVMLCDPVSIQRAVAQLAAWNLVLGEGAYLIARRPVVEGDLAQCYAMQSYRGKVFLLTRRYKLIENFQAQCYYANEPFSVTYGSRPDVRHEGLDDPQSRGALKGFYAIGDERGGGARHVVVMHRSEVDKIRKDFSDEWADGDLDDIEWYGLRTVTHRFGKRIPIGADVRRVITEDPSGSETDFGDEEDIPSLTFERGSTVTVIGAPQDDEHPFVAMQNAQTTEAA